MKNHLSRRLWIFFLCVFFLLAGSKTLAAPHANLNIQQLISSAHAKPVIVAVIDSGVDYTHEDLLGKMWINQAELHGLPHVDDDNNGCVDDIYGCDFRTQVFEHYGYHPGLGGSDYEADAYLRPDGIGHGTHVAGIIAAVRGNGIGIDGVSIDARIMAISFILPNNNGRMSDAAKAIRYAVDNGAQIINASFGRHRIAEDQLQALDEALTYAAEKGVLVVASAGNHGQDIDKGLPFYPAAFDHQNILTVAAVTADGELWASSNFGHFSIDIAAPGVDILSTVPVGPTSMFRKLYDPTGYKRSEGTSIAAPYVTGLAAQILAHNPTFSPQQIRGAILDLAETRASLFGKTVRGGKIPSIALP